MAPKPVLHVRIDPSLLAAVKAEATRRAENGSRRSEAAVVEEALRGLELPSAPLAPVERAAETPRSSPASPTSDSVAASPTVEVDRESSDALTPAEAERVIFNLDLEVDRLVKTGLPHSVALKVARRMGHGS